MENNQVPTEEQIDDLFKSIIAKGNVNLTDAQRTKLREACYKVYIENPGNNFNDHVKTGLFYLNLIREFPNCTL